jgi:hypothetical protein
LPVTNCDMDIVLNNVTIYDNSPLYSLILELIWLLPTHGLHEKRLDEGNEECVDWWQLSSFSVRCPLYVHCSVPQESRVQVLHETWSFETCYRGKFKNLLTLMNHPI